LILFYRSYFESNSSELILNFFAELIYWTYEELMKNKFLNLFAELIL